MTHVIEVTELDLLRAEFRPVDIGYVHKHHPAAVRLATSYNEARAAIDPNDEQTIKLARSRLKRLLAAVGR